MFFHPKDNYFQRPILILRASAARSASKCPPSGAFEHVTSSQEQFFPLAHFSISKCPPFAAEEHIDTSQGQLFSKAHFNIAR
jgi:hypothetical protein